MSGTLVGPTGAAFGNGRLIIQVTKRVLNTCVTPAVVVPSSVSVTVTNGAIATSLVPTDCMQPFTPYKVTLKDSTNTSVWTTYWYVTQMSTNAPVQALGGLLYNTGNKYLGDAGMAATSTAGKNVFYVSPNYPAGFRVASVTPTGVAAPGGILTATIIWPTQFADIGYTAVCVAVGGSPFQITTINSVTPGTMNVTATNEAASGSFGTKFTCRGKEP